jgi:hypothetical protein
MAIHESNSNDDNDQLDFNRHQIVSSSSSNDDYIIQQSKINFYTNLN